MARVAEVLWWIVPRPVCGAVRMVAPIVRQRSDAATIGGRSRECSRIIPGLQPRPTDARSAAHDKPPGLVENEVTRAGRAAGVNRFTLPQKINLADLPRVPRSPTGCAVRLEDLRRQRPPPLGWTSPKPPKKPLRASLLSGLVTTGGSDAAPNDHAPKAGNDERGLAAAAARRYDAAKPHRSADERAQEIF
jgi:hypothetical protein